LSKNASPEERAFQAHVDASRNVFAAPAAHGYARMMPIQSLFPTLLYDAEIDDPGLLGELAHSIRSLARDDAGGIRWSRDKRYAGYTSYASLNDLPKRDPAFADLAKVLARHSVKFAKAAAFDLGRKPRLDSMWVNLLKAGGHHSGHIHPHAIISGAFYVEVPPASGVIRFEDPRLPLMMAAPPRADSFVTVEPRPGMLLLWESWLRHEVLAGAGKGERLSISFNFA
jgi:uncharacterized protein (TIGR02466 family)